MTMNDAQGVATQRDHAGRDLLLLVLGLTLGGAALALTAGLPHLPATIPSWERLRQILQGTDVPLAGTGYILTTLAWAIWAWLAGSLLLQLLSVPVERLGRGPAWVRGLSTVINAVSAPVVRKIVQGALVATVVIHLAGRTVPAPAAAPSPVRVEQVIPRSSSSQGLRLQPLAVSLSAQPAASQSRVVGYTVKSGDTLWKIAERYYGSGYEYPRIVTANRGRMMADGQWFPLSAVIQPGWTLQIPLPSTAVEERTGHRYYVVEDGDMLRGIAARFLGDEMRWPEIFELNKGRAAMPDGRVFTNPDLIWPGLRLELPLTETVTPATPEGVAPPHEPAPPQPQQPPGAATPSPAIFNVPSQVLKTMTEVSDWLKATEAAATPADAGTVPTASPAPNPTPERRTTPVPVSATGQTAPAPEAMFGLDGTAMSLMAGALAAGTAAVGGALVMRRRYVRRNLSQPPAPSQPPDYFTMNNFIETELTHSLIHRVNDTEFAPAALVAMQAKRYFVQQGCSGVGIVLAAGGRSSVTLRVRAAIAEQERILECAGGFGH